LPRLWIPWAWGLLLANKEDFQNTLATAAMNVSEWPCFARNYVEEKAKMRIKATEASGDHPLMPQALRLAQQKALEAEAGTEAGATGVQPPLPPPEADLLDDPLGAGRSRVAVNEDPLAMLMGGSPVAAGFDPLSAPPKAAEAAAPISTAQSTNASGYERTGSLVPKLAWDSVKRSILKEFHVEGALNFGAGFAGEGEFDESGGSAGKTVDLRAKKRLQQLEKDAGVVHKGVEMSQVNYLSIPHEIGKKHMCAAGFQPIPNEHMHCSMHCYMHGYMHCYMHCYMYCYCCG